VKPIAEPAYYHGVRGSQERIDKPRRISVRDDVVPPSPARERGPRRKRAGGARERLRRWLHPFAHVRSGEHVTLILLACNGFLMLTAYYLMKTVREPLILLGGIAGLSGAEIKTYASGAQAVLLLAVVPAYGHLVGRVSRIRLLNITGLCLVASLLVFNVLGHAGAPIGVAYYLWLGMASLVGVAQFWSFANDFYTSEQGERLFPLVAAGGSLGAIAGAAAARQLFDTIGALELLLVAAAVLALYVLVYNVIEARSPQDRARRTLHTPARIAPRGAFRLVHRTRYLTLIAGAVLLANLVNTQGEYILAQAVSTRAEELVPASQMAVANPTDESKVLKRERQKVVGRIYGDFYSAVNLAALLLQLFLVGRVFRQFGVHRALIVFPLVVLGSYGLMAAVPLFAVIGVAKLTENSMDYSLHNTTRQALFLPTDREAKYKAKMAIDSFFFRMGDVAAAAVVFAGIHVLQLSIRGIAVVNLLAATGWLVIVTRISRRYQALRG
jgi:AAA family ATP:ADP antiporter